MTETASRVDRSPSPTRRPTKPLLATLILASSLALGSSSILAPSIPAIGQSLGVSVSPIQLSFAVYLAAFAAGVLILGPVSDRWGRRQVLLIGLALAAAGSLGGAVSPSVGWLIAMRLVQGLGCSAGTVVSRALIADLYDRDEAARTLAMLGFAATLVQVVAPLLGGQVEIGPGWRASFALIACCAALGLALAAYHVPVTAAARSRATVGDMVAAGRRLLGHRRFLGYALTAAGAHAGSHAFAAGAAPVLIARFGVDPAIAGLCAALPPIGFLVGSFCARKLAGCRSSDTLIGLGLVPLTLAGCAMLILTMAPIAHPAVIVAPMIVISAASGLITPNAIAGSLAAEGGASRGTASGLTTFLQISGGIAATLALSLFAPDPSVLAVVIAGAGALALVVHAGFALPRRAILAAPQRTA